MGLPAGCIFSCYRAGDRGCNVLASPAGILISDSDSAWEQDGRHAIGAAFAVRERASATMYRGSWDHAVPLSWRGKSPSLPSPRRGLALARGLRSRVPLARGPWIGERLRTIRPLRPACSYPSYFGPLLFLDQFSDLILSLQSATTAALMGRAGYRSGTVAHPSPADDREEGSGHARSGTPGLILAAVVVALIFAAVFYSQLGTRFCASTGHWRTARLTQSTTEISASTCSSCRFSSCCKTAYSQRPSPRAC